MTASATEAAFDPAASAWTADGRKAEIFSISPCAMAYPIEGFLKDREGRRYPAAFDRMGRARRQRVPSDDISNRPSVACEMNPPHPSVTARYSVEAGGSFSGFAAAAVAGESGRSYASGMEPEEADGYYNTINCILGKVVEEANIDMSNPKMKELLHDLNDMIVYILQVGRRMH